MCIVLAGLCMFLSEAQKKFRFGVSWPSRPGMGLGDGEKERGFGMWSECTSSWMELQTLSRMLATANDR